jgi:predicted ArsR family transcriptional regulator
MNGLTLTEISENLGISVNTLRQRITRLGIKPKSQEAIYDQKVLNILKSVPGKGRPPKPKPEAIKKESADKPAKKGKNNPSKK